MEQFFFLLKKERVRILLHTYTYKQVFSRQGECNNLEGL